MANSPQAIKRARQGKKRRLHNASLHSEMRTAVKKIYALIQAEGKAKASASANQVMSMIDKIANKGIIHPNKAARMKSRLNRHLRESNAA